jgi:hypothetical protein
MNVYADVDVLFEDLEDLAAAADADFRKAVELPVAMVDRFKVEAQGDGVGDIMDVWS